MKKEFLILPFLTFLLCSCPDSGDSNSNSLESSLLTETSSTSTDDGITKVELNLDNYERYISCTKHQGFIGAAGYSPYMAWLEFKGLLSIGVYDVTVTYKVGNASYDFALDVSGGGKTDPFDRNLDCKLIKVSGTVTYRL